MKMAESPFKSVENTVGKGEIARNEQFLLFPHCFQKSCTADTEKPGLVWEWVNGLRWLSGFIFSAIGLNLFLQTILTPIPIDP